MARNYASVNWNGKKRHFTHCFYECIVFALARFHSSKGRIDWCVVRQDCLISITLEHRSQKSFLFTIDADYGSRCSKKWPKSKSPSLFCHVEGFWVAVIIRNNHLAILSGTMYSFHVNIIMNRPVNFNTVTHNRADTWITVKTWFKWVFTWLPGLTDRATFRTLFWDEEVFNAGIHFIVGSEEDLFKRLWTERKAKALESSFHGPTCWSWYSDYLSLLIKPQNRSGRPLCPAFVFGSFNVDINQSSECNGLIWNWFDCKILISLRFASSLLCTCMKSPESSFIRRAASVVIGLQNALTTSYPKKSQNCKGHWR